MSCHTDGNCCGPGSYCCQNNAPHEHPEVEAAMARHNLTERQAEDLVAGMRLVERLKASKVNGGR
jgi:hypothetical protein